MRRRARGPTLISVLRRWILPGFLGVCLVAAGAASTLTDDEEQSQAAGVGGELVRAQAPSEDEPVDGTVPSTVPPFYSDYESMCPGLDLKPELIPPHFETRIGLIPDPEPYEICLLLAEAAEERAETDPPAP